MFDLLIVEKHQEVNYERTPVSPSEALEEEEELASSEAMG
jgi:hypothetical protein